MTIAVHCFITSKPLLLQQSLRISLFPKNFYGPLLINKVKLEAELHTITAPLVVAVLLEYLYLNGKFLNPQLKEFPSAPI